MANVVSSQIDIHESFGGVVPEIASRQHIKNIVPVVKETFNKACCKPEDIDAVAVTYGPGLVGALLVGLSFGKAAAYALDVPLIGVNHLVGHIYAGFLSETEISFPVVSLVVSGGHSSILYITDYNHYEVMGQTRDDAAGEVLDKIARALDLGYPGGPKVEKKAAEGDPYKYEFPKAWLEEGSYDFSFSGLKSAILNFLNTSKQRGEEFSVEDVAASFQEAVLEVLVGKTVLAAKEKDVKNVLLAGGVAANQRLRNLMREQLIEYNIELFVPPVELCTDNAAMIGCAAYYQYINGNYSDLTLDAVPGLRF